MSKSIPDLIEDWASIYLYRSLTGFFDYLKIAGLSMQQAYVLTYIFYNGPSNISQIGEQMMVSAAAASQMVDRLEKQDLVERVSQAGDRRIRNVVLSEKGEAFVKLGIESRQRWLKGLPAKLSDEQQVQISEALKALISLSKEKSKLKCKE
jgi:DNA-binding MarR family transcriptional regulator